MDRDLMSAVHSLFPSLNGPASRLTPSLFLVYLHIFETATAPNLTVSQPAQLCCSDATWEPIKDAVPLKRIELVKFALRAQRCCSAVVIDSRCWTRFLTIVNSPCGSLTALPAPHPQFLHEAKAVVNSILQNHDRLNIHLPRFFQDVYPDQALLLLVTGALGLRILSGPLCPALPVLNTYKGNVWALEWLWATLSSNAERLNGFMQELSSEMENTADGDKLPVLHTIVPTVFSSTENWDHTYNSPATVKRHFSQVEASSQSQLYTWPDHTMSNTSRCTVAPFMQGQLHQATD
uniref:uncharacterized protein LOC109973293 isoform X2 n=1 Tax=Monopterus albus TaxID=43700 RepID=UPI0009B3700F|nr:uncharacterized protein LOC109973293 isoform X2 [Monopterus albus]